MIRVEHLGKKFGNNTVFKDLNVTINNGDRVVIIGPSGSGKSTFLRCLNYLEKPTSGKIYFNNVEVNNDNILAIRKKMGMVFQNFNLFNNLSILDNIILAPVELKLMSKEEATKKALELLKRIDLSDKKDAMPSDLSGGQKQRVAIIRSLIMNPEIMLFDEPTSALDPEMIGEVLELMNDVGSKGMTMVVVTHELNFARKFASKVLFLADKQIMEEGTPEEIFDHPKTTRLKDFLAKI
jgi:arginine/lysine/histidine transport system ATP-binding protein